VARAGDVGAGHEDREGVKLVRERRKKEERERGGGKNRLC